MKRLIALLIVLLLLSGTCAFAEKEETTVAPSVKFASDFYVGYLNQELSITVTCLNKSTVTVPEKYLELRNHRGEVIERAFWRNPRYSLTFSVYVTEEMLGANSLSVWYDGVKISQADAYAAFSDKDLPRVKLLEPSEPAVAPMIVCSGATERQVTAMLDTLDKYNVKATFYITGDFLSRTPDLVKRIVDAGHEIGSHGNNLIDMTQVSYDRARRNIRDLNDACEEVLGVRPRLFCGHLGATNVTVTAIVRAEGMESCQCAFDIRDWSESYAGQYNQLVYRATCDSITSGMLVQFHINGYRSAEVLDAGLNNWINVRGYKVVTVSELMALSGRELPPLPDIPENESTT